VRALSAAIASHFFVTMSHASTFFPAAVLSQGVLHYSPTEVACDRVLSLVIAFLAPVGGWLGDRLGSRLLCTAGSALTAASMFGFAQLGASSGRITVMAPLMLLGLGWSLFQSPNLIGMFKAVQSRDIGSVSGLSLTSANIGNAVGVAVGSVLFTRWLNFYGLASTAIPPYTQWGNDPAVFIKAFQSVASDWIINAHLNCHLGVARGGRAKNLASINQRAGNNGPTNRIRDNKSLIQLVKRP
jgi:MFS family permease